MSRPTVAQRYFAKIDRTAPAPEHMPEADPCWIWGASADRDGYGVFYLDGRLHRAHRAIYTLTRGPIPEGMVIDHRCFVHECVNPTHLRAVSRRGNAEHRRGANRGLTRTSTYRGVSWHSRMGAWQATVGHNGRTYWGGLHSTPEAAAKVAQAMRLRLHDLSDMDRLPGREDGAQALAGVAT